MVDDGRNNQLIPLPTAVTAFGEPNIQFAGSSRDQLLDKWV